jgi:outer membrane lipoprotein carrier protein
VALAGPPAPKSPSEALAHRIEERHRRAGDFTARFVQTYRSGMLSREVVERGVLSVKRPGRMLWEYKDPEKKTFVSDGKRYYFYVPADRQVVVGDQAGDRGVAAFLLSSQGDLLSAFETGLETAPTGQPRLRLTPRKADPEVERVFLEVDDEARILAIEVIDVQGNRSQFRFEQLRENVGLPDSLFQFKVPPGVQVIQG